MTNGTVGTEASQQRTGSEIYSQTYQDLLEQQKKIDKEILQVKSKLLKAIKRDGRIASKRAAYVNRIENKKTLALAIRKCMVPRKEMSMTGIIAALEKKNLYHTNSKYLYTMVNNKLNRDELIKKVSRGIFVYMPKSKRRKTSVA